MSLADVLSAITWPNATGTNITPIGATDPLRTQIEGWLTTLYNGSPLAQQILESAAAAGNLNFLRSSDGSGSGPLPNGNGKQFVALDTTEISSLYYFNDKGELVHEKPELTLIHEIIHTSGQSDPLPPGVPPTNAQMSAAFDFDGDTVRKQNEVAAQLGYTDNIQKNYYSGMVSTSGVFGNFDRTVSYSDGQIIDTAIIPENGGLGNDTLDLTSSYLPNSRDVIFGLAGDDTLNGGGGNDYLYGGDDNDTLIGGAGDDQLWGGMKAETGRTDGIDTVRYQTASSAITISLASSSATAPVTVQDGDGGTDTLHSIEIIEGSDQGDTLILQGLSPEIANAFNYIDLGGGTDIIDVSGLSGAITADLSDSQDQSIIFDGGVLHLKGADGIVGASGGDDTLILGGEEGVRVDAVATLITGGSSAFTYAEFETIQAGTGNARIYGGEAGRYIGGSGTNYIEGSGNAVLESTSGDTYFSISNGGTVVSGAGNDYIDIIGSAPVTIKFGVGSGHDMLGPYFHDGVGLSTDNFWLRDRNHDTIWFEGLSSSDIELVWDFTEVEVIDSMHRGITRIGEAAIRINSTGETLYLGTLRLEISYPLTELSAYDEHMFLRCLGSYIYERQEDNYNYDNENDGLHNTHDLNVFTFDGVAKYNLFDLFDLEHMAPQMLSPEATAAADVLERMNDASDPSFQSGSAGDDNLTGTNSGDDLFGGAGNDTLDGGEGNDFLQGGDGDDLIIAGAGNDKANGNAGSDIYDASAATAPITVDLAQGLANGIDVGSDTLTSIEGVIGGAGDDVLIAGEASSYLAGNGGADTITGGNGNDTIVGGGGNDILQGGAGDDHFEFDDTDQGFDTIDGGSGWDQLTAGWEGAVISIGSITNVEAISGAGWSDVRIQLGGQNDAFDLSQFDIQLIDRICGGAGDDIITGSYRADKILGEAGDDTLIGGEGSNILDGGDGNDTILYGSAADSVTANLGTNSVTIRNSSDIDTLVNIENVVGSIYNDTITGSAQANVLYGAGADDLIDAGEGSDALYGGTGFDTVSFASLSSGVSVNVADGIATVGQDSDTFVEFERYIGSAFADTIVGGASDDVIEGAAGDDVLDGGAGSDTISYASASAGVAINLSLLMAQNTLGAGIDTISGFENLLGSAFNDTLTGDGNDNSITGGAGNDTISGGGGIDTADYSSATSGVTVSLSQTSSQYTGGAGYDTLSSMENLRGSKYNDTLNGSSGANSLFGGEGSDTLWGGAGDDLLDGGAGSDRASYSGAASAVTVDLSLSGSQNTLGAGVDTLVSIERLVGSSFNDTLKGSLEANTIDGGSGNDLIEGGDGDDSIIGGSGTDTVTYASATAGVTVNLALATTQNTVGAGADTITTVENLTGSAFDDTLKGSTAANTITGADGNDTIYGGAGNDILLGGAGADVFVFDTTLNASSNVDKLNDFAVGVDDIQLSQAIFSAVGSAGELAGSAFQVGTAANDAQDRIIYDSATGKVYYDVDGNGAAAQILFAQITAGLAMTNADFIVGP